MQLTKTAQEKLQAFEERLDPRNPEAGDYSPRIIGYGEMSTVFTFNDDDLRNIAFKRMALFHSEAEVEKYKRDYLEYNDLLKSLGLQLPEHGAHPVAGKKGNIVLYLSQEMLDSRCIGNKLIARFSREDSLRLFDAILARFDVIFEHNRQAAQNPNLTAVGFDGQLSNWALGECDGGSGLPERFTLRYLDTSTPLMQKKGVEQLDPELFLRICPAALVWVIRLFFLKDVLSRYYDQRLVIVDLIANLFKEKKSDLIEPFIELANKRLKESRPDQKPITFKETESYYKEDAMIWRLFLAFRRMERYLRWKLGGRYELILPGKIER